MPKVSILLPTYNGAPYIKDALDSVLNQSYQDWELIVTDDASTDNTGEVVMEYANKDARISYVRNEKNLRLPGNLNKGLSLSSGEYIARIDEDDVWSDGDKLKKQVEFLDAHPNCVLIGTGFRMVDEHGMRIKDVISPAGDRPLRRAILSYNPFGHSTVLFRKKTALELGGYDAGIRYGEDYDLWLRLGQKGEFANLPEVCMRYLVRNGMSKKWSKWKQVKFHAGLLLTYGPHYPGLLMAILRLGAYVIK